MAELPAAEERWLRVRIELRQGSARFWLDDRMVAWKQDDTLDTQGTMKIVLGPGVRLAEFSVRPVDEPGRFHTIRLGGYVNGRALLGDRGVDPASLPPAGRAGDDRRHPVRLSGRALRLRPSRHFAELLAARQLADYTPSQDYRFAGAAKRDPVRIQLRVPNATYDALYLIAAAEDRPDTIPAGDGHVLPPRPGLPSAFEGRVPLATAASGPEDTQALPVRLADGTAANLWLVRIPLDPGRLSSFADLDVVEIELTKQVRLYRSYPDPINYGLHQAGLPSSVHVYAATLARRRSISPGRRTNFGHVWQAPATASYTATIVNHTATAQKGRLTVVTRSYDGSEETRQEHDDFAGGRGAGPGLTAIRVPVPIGVKLYGYHDVVATLELAGRTWVEKRSLVRLAPDTRSPQWTGQGPLFGYWSYHGGHHTPHAAQIATLMVMAGARTTPHGKNLPESLAQHLARRPATPGP